MNKAAFAKWYAPWTWGEPSREFDMSQRIADGRLGELDDESFDFYWKNRRKIEDLANRIENTRRLYSGSVKKAPADTLKADPNRYSLEQAISDNGISNFTLNGVPALRKGDFNTFFNTGMQMLGDVGVGKGTMQNGIGYGTQSRNGRNAFISLDGKAPMAYVEGASKPVPANWLDASGGAALRRLARAGENMSGVSETDAARLRRRGFDKGMSTGDAKLLSDIGVLPGADQVLSGMDRGAENMYLYTRRPSPGVFPSMPSDASYGSVRRPVDTTAKPVVRRYGRPMASELGGSFSGGTLSTLAPTPEGAGLKDRIVDTIARVHEARERVRGIDSLASGEFKGIPAEQLATSHMAGVLHDERVAASGLLNRLGIPAAWEDLPLPSGRFRPAREKYVGGMPAGYERRVWNDWFRRRSAEREALEGIYSKYDPHGYGLDMADMPLFETAVGKALPGYGGRSDLADARHGRKVFNLSNEMRNLIGLSREYPSDEKGGRKATEEAKQMKIHPVFIR